MNIYDYALEKIAKNRNVTDILVKKIKSSEKVLNLSNDDLVKILFDSRIRDETINNFLIFKNEFVHNREKFLKKYEYEIERIKEKFGVEIISFSDKKYPNQLKNISNIPLNLYVKGNINFDFSKSIAIVGTRNVSSYAKEKVADISKVLAKEGFCIISGLARGVDSQAHSSTVAVNGKTIAVLPFLSEEIYPPENDRLAKEILENGGGIISDTFSFTKRYDRFLFTERNRIISGLSKFVLIAEGSEKSGSLSQYNHAKKQRRQILTLKPLNEHEGTFMPKKIVQEGGIAINSAKEIIDLERNEKQLFLK